MKKTIQLTGLDCAACAAELEEIIGDIDGVISASVVFVTQKLIVEYDTDECLQKIIAAANDFEEVSVVEAENFGQSTNGAHAHHHEHKHAHEHEHGHCDCECCAHSHTNSETNGKEKNAHRREWLQILISAVCFGLGILFENVGWRLVGRIISYVCFAVAYFVVGLSVWKETISNLKKGRIFDENFLMALASVGAVCIGETEEAVLVMLLYQIGELLQAIAVGSSRKSIADLMELKSESATLVTETGYKHVLPEEIEIGDVFVVKAGEKVPVDGVLVSDEGIWDTKSLTGESEYRHAKKGEEVLSGCINAGGVCEIRAVRVYQDSAVHKILDLVENASSAKAQPEKFITKFAKYYTPIVCVLACVVAFVCPLFNGWISGGVLYKDFGRWVQSALTFLVISCPCALIISVPLTYFSGIGVCAKAGVLVKGATHLDEAAKVKIAAFDKTGTLTKGNFTVCAVYPENGQTEEDILSIAAAIEEGSAHPIAKAFENESTERKAEDVLEASGRGLIAYIDGERYYLGAALLLRENGIEIAEREGAYTFVYLAKETTFLGSIAIGDRVREEAKETIKALKKMGVEQTVMLTGDRKERAMQIADEVGIDEVNAELLPDQKLEKAKAWQQKGKLLYVGDGINDAPVMTIADCAVSMGGLGSAAAVEASDMVLISDCLSALPKGIAIARKTRRIVMQNIIGSLLMKVGFMVLGLCGVLPLWLAVFADVGVMLLAVLNSFRVRRTK